MTKNDKIQEAIKMIDSHDWYWMMAEEFTRYYNRAKDEMKAFVMFVSTFENEEVRKNLKAMWMLYYDRARAAIDGKEFVEFESKKSEILKALAC